MDQHDIELIQRLVDQDAEMKTLWSQHQQYEKQLEKLESKPFLTPAEEIDAKEIKKKKLAGKTKLETMLRKYR